MLTILHVAYPLAVAREDAVGGAEAVMVALDKALVSAGHRSIVLARAGSKVAGKLVPVAAENGALDESAISRARQRHAAALREALSAEPVDLVHMHGHDFDRYLPPPGPPVLVTLHCPAHWYSSEALRPTRPETWLNGVSQRQQATFPPGPSLLPAIENGVAIPKPFPDKRSSYALMLSRIAPEKGVHVALAAARSAGLPLILAGEVAAYPDHQRYFAHEVTPLLDAVHRFIGPVAGERKSRLIGRARCVVVPSLVEETSCIVAREALAAGTPVVAFPRGALADIVEHGVTGYLVDDVKAMARAMVEAVHLDHDRCRESAIQRFSLDAMIGQYFQRYQAIAAKQAA